MTFDVSLRPVTGTDVDEFFAHSEARRPGTPQDYKRFSAHWRRQLVDPTVKVRTITVAGQVVPLEVRIFDRRRGSFHRGGRA
jgi:hypothetical protein